MKPLWIVALCLVSLGFFYQTLFFGRIPVPADDLVGLYHPWRDTLAESYPRGVPYKNFLITDPIRQQIPWKKVVADAWKSGHAPTFNPYTFAGVPLDANVQAQPYYPLNILFLIIPFVVAWTVLIILQPMIAAVGMYMYLRHLRLSHASSALGGIVWAFCGFSIAWMSWGTISHAAAWLPVLLLATDGVATSPAEGRARFAWLTVLVGALIMTITGGHIQVSLYAIGLAVAYAVWRLRDQKRDLRPIMATYAAAIGVTAIQWVPFVRFVLQSGRIGSSDSWIQAGWFLPWQHLVQFFSPDFFGNPATLNYWGEWNYGEFVGYIGIIPLVLAIGAMGWSGVVGFFTLAGGVSLLFMLPTGLSSVPFLLHLPVISVLQPTRLMVLVDFSLAVLAAFGMESFVSKRTRGSVRSLLTVGGVLLLLWAVSVMGSLSHPSETLSAGLIVARKNLVLPTLLFCLTVGVMFFFRVSRNTAFRRMALAAVLAISVFDLFRFGWKFTPFTPASYFFPPSRILSYLSEQRKPFRVITTDDRILPPNVGAYYGIETLDGYDPIAPSDYEDFLVASERGSADIRRPTGFNRIFTAHNISSPLLRFANVQYVLSLTDLTLPTLRPVMREGETRLYAFTDTLPRVYMAGDMKRVSTPSDMLGALFTIPASDGAVYSADAELLRLPVQGREGVHIISYASDIMRLSVVAASKRLIVVSNRYDPRWRVVMDGRTALTPLRVNYLFFGVIVPEGTHDIMLSYR